METNELMSSKSSQKDGVSIREVYELIDRKMGEVQGSVSRLENKFDTLESGRLTALEREVSTMNGKMMMIPVLISIAISIFGFALNYFVLK